MLAEAQTLTAMAIIRDSLPGCCITENVFIFTILKMSLFDGLATWRVLACSKVLVMQNANQVYVMITALRSLPLAPFLPVWQMALQLPQATSKKCDFLSLF